MIFRAKNKEIESKMKGMSAWTYVDQDKTNRYRCDGWLEVMCGCPTVVCIDDDADDDDVELTLTDVFGNAWTGVTAAAADDEDADDGFVIAFIVVVVVVGVAAFVIDVDDVDGTAGGYWKTFGCDAAFDADFGVSFIECCCDA